MNESALVNLVLDFVAVAAGAVSIAWGFAQFKKSRLIADIPTSKIRSVAMGLAEIKGAARAKFPLQSRLMKVDCVYYKFTIEVERRNAKGGAYWEKTDEGESSNYFYVEDSTGKILVDPLGAQVILPWDYRYIDEKGTQFSRRKVRYTEWRIEPGEDVYVMGTARSFRDETSSRRDRLAEKIRALKADRQKMKSLDTDGDGVVSAEEWDKGVAALEEEIVREDLASTDSPDDSIVIAAGPRETIFLISDRSEKDVLRRLAAGAAAAVFGGFCIIIVSAASACARLGVIGMFPPVPWTDLIFGR